MNKCPVLLQYKVQGFSAGWLPTDVLFATEKRKKKQLPSGKLKEKLTPDMVTKIKDSFTNNK